MDRVRIIWKGQPVIKALHCRHIQKSSDIHAFNRFKLSGFVCILFLYYSL